MAVLRGARSVVAAALVGLAWILMTPFLRLVVVPGSWLFPRYRIPLTSTHMKAISWLTLNICRLGGGRFRRKGTLPTDSPIYIVANHQAIFDILQACLMSQPYAPAFVTRARYQKFFIPHVSTAVRLIGGPFVDPKNDPKGAIRAIKRAARELTHGLLIFPESHRTKTGEVERFRPAGLESMLRERRLPVYVVVNDGTWRARRVSDAIFRVHLMDGWSEVVGRFEPPEDNADLPAFIETLRAAIVDKLAELRATSLAEPPTRP